MKIDKVEDVLTYIVMVLIIFFVASMVWMFVEVSMATIHDKEPSDAEKLQIMLNHN